MLNFLFEMAKTQKIYETMNFRAKTDRTGYSHHSKTFKKNRRKQLKISAKRSRKR